MGVKVLDSEEVEKNLFEQASILSEKQTTEYKERSIIFLFQEQWHHYVPYHFLILL